MKIQWAVVIAVLISFNIQWSVAQTSLAPGISTPEQMQPTLRKQAKEIIQAKEWEDRLRADSLFTRTLVQTLKSPYSFRFPFDSLETISVLYAPDSAFRIFSWQLMKDFTFYRQKGAIQYNTTDGKLKLTPLFDVSPFTDAPCDSVRDANQWIGAVYYKILLNIESGKKYYTLLGYDENDARSTKKWMEVLTFTDQGVPKFGGNYFEFQSDDTKPPIPAFRFYLEYKKGGNARLNYDEELKMITFAHLVSENGVPAAHYTLVPEGSFEGFKWMKGKWIHIPFVDELDPNKAINIPKQPVTQPLPGSVLPTPKKRKTGSGGIKN